jgi:CheY-like chemotaxis protein
MPNALVAEDEMLIRELILEDLTDAGFSVTAVSNADDAFAAIENGATFDLLFTDIRMPGSIDGWELGRRTRARIPGVKIIYATGYSDINVALSSDERRITKPYRYEEVVSILREMGLTQA